MLLDPLVIQSLSAIVFVLQDPVGAWDGDKDCDRHLRFVS